MKEVEMPKFLKNSKGCATEKSRTSETISHRNVNSSHIGLDLNGDPTDSDDLPVNLVLLRRCSLNGKPSGLVESLFSQRQEYSYEYVRIKEREFKLKVLRRQEQT
nr:hypothetical protein [Tanacetum cinerariifolium]